MGKRSDSDMQKIRQRIREMRKQADVSQKEVADRLGIDQTTYSAMERGRQEIYTRYLFPLADVLKMKIWELFADTNDVLDFDSKTKNLLENWNQMDDNGKKVFLGMSEQVRKLYGKPSNSNPYSSDKKD